MSEFKELIKSFSKSREYVRDFFVYGFKSREDFDGWSGRTYDNERRRLESWLAGYVRQEYHGKEKNISLSIDSNLLDTNPLYRVWKAKSFTDNDIMLHFYLLDSLLRHGPQTAEGLTDRIQRDYGILFDPQTLRRKCNQYSKEGILLREKAGRELLYRPGISAQKLLSAHPGLRNALKLYQLSSPLGILGNTLLDQAALQNDLFRVKHAFFVHTLEDEILLSLLQAIREEKAVYLRVKSTRSDLFREFQGVPLNIFISTRTGRRFLCLYRPEKERFSTVRLDAIKAVSAGQFCQDSVSRKIKKAETAEHVSDFRKLREKLEQNKKRIWGVSFQNQDGRHLEHVRLTLHIDEYKEPFLLNRLRREGKGGSIRRIAPDTFVYEIDVFDANEMLPWIRTFTGRILDLASDSEGLAPLFRRDLSAMYRMYFGEENTP